MKLKKLFAGVVAAAMMATMAMPSFAAKHTYNEGTLEDHDSITVTKFTRWLVQVPAPMRPLRWSR